MKLLYSKESEKALKKLPQKERVTVLKRIKILAEMPVIGKLLKGRLSGYRSLRAWPYRIIYKAEKNKILIINIGHRQGVYK